jgi:multimeric flavodoxin WrbA
MGTIVAVSCSPKTDGSSSRISDAFLDGAMGLSTNIIRLHRVSKFKAIQDCHRCLDCKKTCRCSIVDDLQPVLDDIVKADCVVFSTPVYFDSPCALYKMVEDRMYSFLDDNMNSTLPKGKKALLIVTSFYPDTDLPEIAGKLAKNLELIGFEIMGVITYCDYKGTQPVDNNPILLQEAKKMGLSMRNTPVV